MRTGAPSGGPASATATWLAPIRLDYARLDAAWADVNLAAQLAPGVCLPPDGTTLIVHVGRQVTMHPALTSATEEVLTREGMSALLWRVSFDVPLKVVEYPRALFEIGAHGCIVVALPTPQLRVVRATCAVDLRTPYAPRRPLQQRLVAVATALAVVTAGSPAIGLASGPAGTTRRHHARPALYSTAPLPPLGTLHPKAPPGLHHHHLTGAVHHHHRHHVHSGAGATVPPPPASVPPPTLALTTSPHAQPRSSHPAARVPGARPHRHAVHPPSSGGAPIGPVQTITPTPPPGIARSSDGDSDSGFGRLSPAPPDASGFTSGFGADPQLAATLRQLMGLLGTGDRPPKFLIGIYKAAGHRYRIPWQILAAINGIETSYGRDLKTSSAGAIGWMQFMPGTWRRYGVDFNGRDQPNPYDPQDAIFSAARYLAANGAPRHMRKAIFAYNHATWYVDEVLWRAQMIIDHGFDKRHKRGYSLPLAARFLHQIGRTDDGVDIETAPDGAAVFSMTSGIVTAVASNPGGFGPNYPVILVTRGPLAGQYIYYGHVAASLVRVKQRVLAGQPIAIMGHTGDAAYLGHGHIEIGFSDAAGDPLNHHGSAAWTPSGDAMRHFLIALSRAYGIKNS